MDVTVEALIRAGIPAGEIVTGEAGDEPADAWPMGLKRGPVRTAPAAVVAARSAATVSLVLRAAGAAGATVQVEGARTNVVGCLDGQPDVVLRLAMDRIVDLDATSQVVTVEAGVNGGVLEDFLNDRGLTLGHYPQSLHHSTVGGWIATRATGTASARFGGLEQMVRGLEGVLPGALQSEVGELADRLWMHSSHIYPTGAGLYLAFWIDDADDDSACARAEAVWARALDLADVHGGAIGHHHGIGAVRGAIYTESVEGRLHRSIKRALDPEGVLAARLLDG